MLNKFDIFLTIFLTFCLALLFGAVAVGVWLGWL